jgi:2-methylisocitrate lyase-like PEP mutase family enzyme
VVGRSVNGPNLVNVFEGGKTPMLGAAELEAMGFRLGIYPSQTHRAAIFAIKETLAVLKSDGDTNRIENRLATFTDREEAVDSKRWRAIETKYLENV